MGKRISGIKGREWKGWNAGEVRRRVELGEGVSGAEAGDAKSF